MIKRLFWLTLGFGLGVGVSVSASRALRRTLERYVPRPAYERLRAMNAALDDRAALIRARARTGS